MPRMRICCTRPAAAGMAKPDVDVKVVNKRVRDTVSTYVRISVH